MWVWLARLLFGCAGGAQYKYATTVRAVMLHPLGAVAAEGALVRTNVGLIKVRSGSLALLAF